MYCKKCGGKIESYASNCPFCGEPVAHNSVEATYTASGEERGNSRSVWGWIGIFILMGINPINIILLLIWSFGQKTKSDPTFRNWARAQLLVMVLATILVLALVALLLPYINELLLQYEDLVNQPAL